MAISNYGELKTAIATWTYGADSLSGLEDEIVTLASAELNTRIRHREMVETTDLSPTSGVFTLPSDYLQWRRVTEKASLRRKLEYLTLEQAEELYASRPAGLGCHFTITGNSLRVYPTTSNDIELSYFTTLNSLSDDADTNWLLTKYPHVYLIACQKFAAELIKEWEDVAFHDRRLQTHIDRLNAMDDAGEFGNAQLYPSGIVA